MNTVLGQSFYTELPKTNTERTYGELLADELKNAEIQLVRHAQSTEFQLEWKALSRGSSLPANSKLQGLQPKLDEDRLLLSHGRLKHAEFLSLARRSISCHITKKRLGDETHS